MPEKKNEARTIKTRQILKNPRLALGMSRKDIGKYKKVAAAYGNVAPVIVCAQESGGGRLILAGSARLEACAQMGINEIPAVMADAGDEAGQLKLSLMLSAIREEVNAITEGALINCLISEHGVAPRELVNLLGKSKAWVSKRLTMDQNLAAEVKAMVADGVLCPRSAEEVAKMPSGVQAGFTANAVNVGLNKTEIGFLVQQYRNTYSEDVRKKIISAPLEALSSLGQHTRKKLAGGAGHNGPGHKLGSAANYAIQMILKAVNMAESANEQALHGAGAQLNRLADISAEAAMSLNKVLADVSPGKQGGNQTW